CKGFIFYRRMKPMRVAVAIELSDEERATLEKWARSRTTQVRLAQRAKAILLASQGLENQAIAEQVDIGRVAVGRWRNRFAEHRLAGIEKDAPRGGRKAGKRQYWAPVIVDTTLHMLPANGTHWSTRTLADTLGID